jgi:hypothetical protein
MTPLIVCTTGLLLLTKAADCLTTLFRVPTTAETNPLSRALMDRVGHRNAIALVFGVSVAIVAAASSAALLMNWWPATAAYVILGSAIAAIQLAVAHTNWTGRMNPITQRVARLHGFLSGPTPLSAGSRRRPSWGVDRPAASSRVSGLVHSYLGPATGARGIRDPKYVFRPPSGMG